MRSSLQARIDAARGLREDAALIGDYLGFMLWREQLARWRSDCGELLRRDFALEAMLEFLGGLKIGETSPTCWRDGVRSDVRELVNMIELLRALQGTLVARGA